MGDLFPASDAVITQQFRVFNIFWIVLFKIKETSLWRVIETQKVK